MVAEASPHTIVAVDIGSAHSHGALIEPVEGTHRLIAIAETPIVGAPQVDLLNSLQRCLARLEESVERSLLAPDGAPDGSTALIVTTSAAPPLDCALIGLTERLSLQSGLAVCRASHAAVRRVISLAQSSEGRRQALAALRDQPPEVIVLVGGVDGGPTSLLLEAAAALAELFAALAPTRRPAVILAGNPEARRPIGQILGAGWDYDVVDNVQPALYTIHAQELQRELAQRYAHTKLPQLDGYGVLAARVSAPILASDAGVDIVLQFLSREGEGQRRVLGLDWGARQVTAALADQGLTWSRTAPAEQAVPLPADADPWALYAAAQQALAPALASLAALRGEPSTRGWAVDLIAARGGPMAATEGAPWEALALLDALAPQGATQIVLDWASLWPQLGALAQVAPLAAWQVLRHDAMLELGTVIGLPGQGKPGRRAGNLRLGFEAGEAREIELRWGSLQRLPLSEGARVTAELSPGGIGQLALQGGGLGLLVDARGRPLALPEEPEVRRRAVEEWLEALA